MLQPIKPFLFTALLAVIGVNLLAIALLAIPKPNERAIEAKPPLKSSSAHHSSKQIDLPYRKGETWYICQSYQGQISHQTRFAFDLTVAKDFGMRACHAADGNVNKSAGKPVLAPIAGTAIHNKADFICLQIDSQRSLLIGHIDRTVANKAKVSKDAVLGKVSRAARVNGGYAHIHIEPYQSANCQIGTSVPFTAANGFQIKGMGDFPDLSGVNDYFKKALTRP